MGRRLGVIAGSGEFPYCVCEEAQNRGYSCVVAGIKGEAESALREKVSAFEWFDVHEIANVIAFFRKKDVGEAVFAGKIDQRVVYKSEELRKVVPMLLENGKDRGPTALIQAAINIFSSQGINIQDPTKYIVTAFCTPGILTKTKPSQQEGEDILYGWEVARKLADLDIGQTVVVKKKAVVALEGIEGTDETIKRGGQLAGDGIIVVKISRTSQDPRVDLPAVGLHTVESLVQAKGRALVLEAEKIPFFQKERAISLAEAHGVSIVAKK
jgi:DUF1009 family protein